jgi:ABC transporter substrate binding protein
MGYVEGQNVSIQYRWITDRYDALPAMAADLVQRQVAVILALGPPAVFVAKAATQTIPIIFVTGADPLKFGFVASFNKPGGNITGIWMVTTVLAEKRLQLLHDLVPKAELVGLLVNPTSPVSLRWTTLWLSGKTNRPPSCSLPTLRMTFSMSVTLQEARASMSVVWTRMALLHVRRPCPALGRGVFIAIHTHALF